MYQIKKGVDRFYAISDGNIEIGELTYFSRGNYLVANHTYVDPKYRGQNIARELLNAFVEYCRQEKKKIIPICSYIQAVFAKNKNEYRDVWDEI